MKSDKLLLLAIWINSAADRGIALEIDEVRKQAEAGTLFEWLVQNLPDPQMVSIIRGPGRKVLNDEWQRHENAISSRESFGVSKDGLCLVMTYVLASLQSRAVNAVDNLPPSD